VDEKPSPESMKRRRRVALRLLGVLLLAGAAGLAAWWWWGERQLKGRLAQAVAELDRTDPGWRLEDIEAARVEVPEAENSARVVVAVRALLPRSGWPPTDLDESLYNLLPNEQLNARQTARLGKELAAQRQAVRQARRLAGMPLGRHRIVYKVNVMEMSLDDQQKSRTAAALLRYDALHLAQAGDMQAALTSSRAILNAARSVGDEPQIISQLVRMAGVAVACGCVERVLAQGEPSPSDLAALQALLEEEDRHPRVRIAFRGEQASQHALFDALERGEINLRDLESSGRARNWRERLSDWRTRANFPHEHPLMLELFTERVEAAKLHLHEQIKADQRFQERAGELPEQAIMTRLLVPALHTVSVAARRTHAEVRCMAALLALERYRRAHKGWPAALAELTPKYLAAVPLDPFDGKPLRYGRVPDGVIVYSVGQDGVDNGGVLNRDNPIRDGADLGYQIWDVASRRQPPRPRPPAPPN
jgi:hypothetical protein